VAGYLAASRVAPSDNKNLARCFPGDEDGTYTERVAFALTRDFISLPEVTAVIDLHSAGRVARMVTLVGYNLFRDPVDAELGAMSQALARAIAMPLVWGHRCDPDVCARSSLNEEKGSRYVAVDLLDMWTTACRATWKEISSCVGHMSLYHPLADVPPHTLSGQHCTAPTSTASQPSTAKRQELAASM
jgi:hypothetical protein